MGRTWGDGTSNRRILVVDDDPAIRTLLREILDLEGYRVVEASGGEDGLRKIRRARFDLILLDIMMPGTSGHDVLEKVRAMPARAQTPVIVITARDGPGEVLQDIGYGVADHIAKPFEPTLLLRAIARALEGTPEQHRLRAQELDRGATLYVDISELWQTASKER